MKKSATILIIALAAMIVGTGCTTPEAVVASAKKATLRVEPAPHRWLLIGDARTYAVLRTTGQKPEDFLVVLEIAWPKGARAAAEAIGEDRRRTGEATYTMLSEPFALTDLAGTPPRPVFHVDLYRGDGADDGRKLASGVPTEVKRVLLFRRVSEAGRPADLPVDARRYFVFGANDDLFALRLVRDLGDEAHLAHVAMDAAAREDVRRYIEAQGAEVAVRGEDARPSGAVDAEVRAEGRRVPVALRFGDPVARYPADALGR
jgi:hypothetical protein